MTAPGGATEAAVLVPIFGWPDEPGLVFTERRADLRRHAGEISFPGGRRDHHTGEELIATALREAQELPPVGTFVTGYRVYPIVGLIPPDLDFRPSPHEVAAVLLFMVDELRAGFAMRRLVRRGVPIRTPTYVVGEHLIWGATARILGELLERLEPPARED